MTQSDDFRFFTQGTFGSEQTSDRSWSILSKMAQFVMLFPHHILAQNTFHQVLRLLKKAQPWSLSLEDPYSGWAVFGVDSWHSWGAMGCIECSSCHSRLKKKLREISHVVRWFSVKPTIYRRIPDPQTSNFHGKALLPDVFPHLHHVFDLGPHSALSTRPVGFPPQKRKKQTLMGIS